jgi:Flp pilus assembly pilin Flp
MRRTLRSDERGISTSEYVILLGMIAIAGYLAWRTFGDHVDYGARGAATVMLEDD